MKKISVNIILISVVIGIISCTKVISQKKSEKAKLEIGAEQMNEIIPILKDKRVAMVVNHTTTIGKTHLVDTLLKQSIKITKIFAPEHGFRGTAADGEHISNGKDPETGVQIISLYGSNRKPTAEQLKDVDAIIFDIQDVGARFYTYISTMHYVMEACAEHKKLMLVFDRPNPNGHYVDGPILEPAFKSFVGMHPIPVVHGLTVGELAMMINGEKWLENGQQCELKVIKCKGYTHKTPYAPPIKTSPNLPNYQSVLLYPSICFFEGTEVSVGRGTDTQFQVLGSPTTKNYGTYTFTPEDKPGTMNPPQKGKLCYGQDLRKVNAYDTKLNLTYLLDFYKKCENKADFFLKTNHFKRLAGTESLKKMIIEGKTESEIRASWQEGLNKYLAMRKKYLMYE